MTRDSLEHNQIPIYLIAALLAGVLGWCSPASAPLLGTLITPAIAVLMYAMFLQIPLLQLREALARRGFIAALLLANFVLVPLLVWGLTRLLDGHTAVMIGALLVLLTPCIDYVVVFTHIGKGDSRLMLSATPILLLAQLALLPLYLALILGDAFNVGISTAPFVEAFLVLIVAPLLLALASESLARKSAAVRGWVDLWAWLPVPAMALVLLVVIASQIGVVIHDIEQLLPVLPVYVAFLLIAPMLGALSARLLTLPAGAARAVTFSAATRNSLVVLPLALALPDDLRSLAAAAIVTQTLVELVGELFYIRLIPVLVGRHKR